MQIYNCTTQVLIHLEEEWLEWLTAFQIPAMIQTGCFTEATIYKVKLEEQEETVTYAVQYVAKNDAAIAAFESEYMHDFNRQVHEKWGDGQAGFSTTLQMIEG